MAEVDEMDGASRGVTSRTVFVSYASHDSEVANSVCRELDSRGIRCWIAPRDVAPGALYADAIVRAINECQVLLIVLSQSAVASSHVGREVERAASKHKQIIALRIDAAPLSPALEYFLSESQWIDAVALGMSGALVKLAEATGQVSAPSPQAPIRSRPGAHRRPAKRVVVVAGIAIGLCVAVALGMHFWPLKRGDARRPDVAAISDRSIAVLPFADMSERKDQEYFADGMAEEIIDLLTKVPNLHVPARTSSFFFKGKPTKVTDIARELSVANVLEGSIRRSGNQLRVTAQLIRADSGFHVWSQTYERDLSDVFKVQDDIANAVVQALQISLMGGTLTRQKGGTENLEAYQLYLRARNENEAYSVSALERAREHTERAIKIDPDFTLAWIMLGWVNINLGQLRALPTKDGYVRARELARHALERAPDSADAHYMLGYIHRTYDWDWAAAQAEARQAIALAPTYPYGAQFSGQLAATLGDWDDAERLLRSALVNDPLNAQFHWDLAGVLYRSGRFGNAEAEYRKLIELVPDYAWARGYLAKTLLMEAKPDAALAMATLERDEANRLDILPMILYAAGRQAAADQALQALTSKYADSDAYFVAMNYAYRNDHDLAIQWLERAYKQKDVGFVEIVGEPLFRNIAGDARFKALLRKINLPE
jgi:adenylate cyclase